MGRLDAAAPELIEAHLRHLTVGIGVRLAGSEGDQRAIDYVGREFARYTKPSVEVYPVNERAVGREQLEICLDSEWLAFPCSLFSSTPGTDGRTLEAPICFFEAATEYSRPDLSHLRGKAVVHLGCHIESRENYRRLMASDPAFLLFVDVRFPGSTPLADGMFPAYTKALGAKPTVNVAYMDAWRWKVEGATAARIRVDGGMRPGQSANVIAELPGSEPEAGMIVAGGHHDTQANSVGADDDASGVVALLELARILAPRPRRRTVRLVSFGAEEQLSVGSAEYVRQHRSRLESDGVFMLNFDSYASHLGWTELNCCGPEAMPAVVLKAFRNQDLYASVNPDVVPYTDLFPFLAAGVPGVYVGRHNCASGRFFHHRPDDDMSRVSPSLMARVVDASAGLLDELANVQPMPFASVIPQMQAERVRLFWSDLYGGWNP